MSEADRYGGIESEYGFSYAFSQEELEDRAAQKLPRLKWGAAADIAIDVVLKDYLPEGLARDGGDGQFLGNGMRLYQDVGQHPEASGAETADVQELIDGDLGADRLVWRAFRDAYRAGAIQNFMLSRRTIDTSGQSWGRHENYQMERAAVTDGSESGVSSQKLLPLVSFLAVRSLTGGAGCLHNGVFWMGQKITTARTEINYATTTSKPLVNTRDEPHGDEFRNHIVMADYNSPQVTARNFEMTSAALRLIEHRVAPALAITRGVANWAYFARQAAADLTFTYSAEVNGKTMTGLNVHEEFLTRANAMDIDIFSPAEQRGLAKWERIYERMVAVRDAAKEGDPTDLVARAERIEQAIAAQLCGEVDWADRLQHIREAREKNGGIQPWQGAVPPFHPDGLAFMDATAIGARADIMYDLVGTGDGLAPAYMKRLKTPQAAEWVDTSRIEHRIMHAPAVGRAALREKFLYALQGDPLARADWQVLAYAFPESGQLKGRHLRMKDPSVTHDPQVDRFIADALQAQPVSHALRSAAAAAQDQRSAI